MFDALRRPVCDLLGCSIPILAAGMGGVSRHELVAAVSGAGGFAFLGMIREPVDLIHSEVKALRGRGIDRFGVNLVPVATDPVLLEQQISACLDLEVPAIELFWDVSEALIGRLHRAGTIVVCQVGNGTEAQAAERAGAHILIAQGVEAGGHVRSRQRLQDLLPELVAKSRLPVLAAGGLVDGADLASILALGAQGGVFGTAFVATEEAFAHPYHKRRLIESTAIDTVLTDMFHNNRPSGTIVRVLANSVTNGERGDAFMGARIVIGYEGERPIYLFSTDSPLASMTGDFEAMALYAGEGVGRISRIVSAAELVQNIAAHAAALLSVDEIVPTTPVESASPACFSHHVDDCYMGFLSRSELLVALNELLETERSHALVTLASASEAPDHLHGLILLIHQDAARWCGVLTNAILSRGGTASNKTDAVFGQAMLKRDLAHRLEFLNHRRVGSIEQITALLPTVRDDDLHMRLSMMRDSHERNGKLVAAALADFGRS